MHKRRTEIPETVKKIPDLHLLHQTTTNNKSKQKKNEIEGRTQTETTTDLLHPSYSHRLCLLFAPPPTNITPTGFSVRVSLFTGIFSDRAPIYNIFDILIVVCSRFSDRYPIVLLSTMFPSLLQCFVIVSTVF
ncbi:unnamed protein product [Trifolium pratense]|uniref:Uncharacterized protein n=1 Tax=Trifolium pratense TaxID=57577 RepID=A0ACB0LB40_TRIPR|nr:unnamed protein product [Trifolium pratense]